MKQERNPNWWTTEYDSAWERVKAAFRRDWDQTKHDFGGHQPDMNQDVDDTVKQAAGTQPIPPRGVPTYEESESAYRFGYGARQYYGSRYSTWNDDLESRLRDDWQAAGDGDWERFRTAVRRGWEYESPTVTHKAA